MVDCVFMAGSFGSAHLAIPENLRSSPFAILLPSKVVLEAAQFLI